MSKINQVMRRLQSFIANFLLGEKKWGYLRLVFVLLSLIAFTYLGHYAFREYTLAQVVENWRDRRGLLVFFPGFVLRLAVLLVREIRFLWITVAAFIIALLAGASYQREIYRGLKITQTVKYLLVSMFSLRYPNLIIDEGKLQVDEDDPNLIRDIGGPGRVVVQPGNVVLFEHLHTPSKIGAEGVHFLSRFEKVKRFSSDYDLDGREIPTTDDRHGFIESLVATTKDGIPLSVENINYRYRLRLGREFGDFVNRDQEKPNPFSVQAVKDMAYNRTVKIKNPDNGETELTPWHDMVNAAVNTAISDYIREHKFDDIVGSKYHEDARQVITEKIFSRGVRIRLRNYGAELLWWDIGHFKIADPTVADQLVENWGVVWGGEAAFRIARGEAERIKNLEIARAEAQAEMLIETMKAFEKMEVEKMSPGSIRNLMLARLTQLLDGMTDQDFLSSETNDNFPTIR